MILNHLPWKQTDHSVIFEIASKYCILDSFIEYEGYSISSKRILDLLVVVVDTGIHPFQSNLIE